MNSFLPQVGNFLRANHLSTVTAVVLLGNACAVCAAATADPLSSTSQAAPAAALPDWSGFWHYKDFRPGVMKAGIIPFTPPYEAKIEKINEIAAAHGDVPTASKTCTPFGVPFGMERMSEILYAPTHVTMLVGNDPARHIWTDGRAHTEERKLFESFNGESVGHWEGDTLVVDTIGLRPNEIVLGVPVPNMHVVERIRLENPDTLLITTTITSADGLKMPWTYERRYARTALPDTGDPCNRETDRSVDRRSGKQGFDLTPPKGGYIPPGATQ